MVRQAVKNNIMLEPRKVRIINIPGKLFLSEEGRLKRPVIKSDSLLEKGDTITA